VDCRGLTRGDEVNVDAHWMRELQLGGIVLNETLIEVLGPTRGRIEDDYSAGIPALQRGQGRTSKLYLIAGAIQVPCNV